MPIQIPDYVPIVGGQTIMADQPQPASTDTSTRDAYIATLAAAHGPQVGQSSPVVDPKTKKPTNFDTYSFKDGSTIEISADGAVQNPKLKPPSASATKNAGWGTPVPIKDSTGATTYYGTDPSDNQIKPIPGLPSSAATANTSSDAFLANQGILNLGTNGIYSKDPDTGQWGPSTATQAQQQLKDAQTQATTNYSQAQAQKLQIDNALAADPTNQALQQQKLQIDNQFQQAQISKIQTDQQIQQATLDLNKAKTASDITTQAGNLAVSQGNLAVNQQKTASDVATQAGTLAINQAKLPYENQLSAAQAQNYQATAASTLAKANEPTVIQTGVAQPYTTYYDPKTQSMQSTANPSYLPTDPGRMIAQLQQQATAQQQQLKQQVAQGKLTPDQANSQFQDWWGTNVEPMKSEIGNLQASQQAAAQQAQGLAQQALLKPSYDVASLAETASNNAQSRAVSMMPYVTGAGFGQALGQAMSGGFKGMSPQALVGASTYSLPNLQAIGQQGAAAALAHLSPAAQAVLQAPASQAAQAPVPGLPPINQVLNMGAYNFGGAPGAGAPGAGAPPMAGPPPTPMGPTPEQLAAQNAAGNQITNLGPFSGNAQASFPTGGQPLPTNMLPGGGAAPGFGGAPTGAFTGTYGPLSGTSVPWGWPQYQPAGM